PVRARAEAMAPAAARVELADEVEQPRGGGVEVRRQLGDLVTETLQLDGVRIGRDGARAIDVHRRVSSVVLAPTLHRDCCGPAAPLRAMISSQSKIFGAAALSRVLLSIRRAGTVSARNCPRAAAVDLEICQDQKLLRSTAGYENGGESDSVRRGD